MIVWQSRKIHHHNVASTDVAVGMPNVDRDVNEASIVLRKDNAAHLAARRATRSRIKEDQLHFSLQQRVAVLMATMQVPTLHNAGPNSESVAVREWIRMGPPARIE
jgi:hypothetical protein